MEKSELYNPPLQSAKEYWDGRIDDTENFKSFRWHQWIDFIDLTDDNKLISNDIMGFCFLGFCCDKGVVRNKGRAGAAKGPKAIRREISNLPCRFSQDVKLFDAGDIVVGDRELEDAQQALSEAVEEILALGLFPILLGGGHEIAFGHYNGITSYLEKMKKDDNYLGIDQKEVETEDNKNIGIVNFDAHFDIRPYPDGGNSGTMFRQIADKCDRNDDSFDYFCMGIQKYGNTISLFEKAEELGTEYVLAKNIDDFNLFDILDRLNEFITEQDHIYLTICSDVFSSAYAPGVSASHSLGLEPEIVLKLIKHIIKTDKVISFDIAEVSPRFDMDNSTAHLAAIIIFAVIEAFVGNE